jgi:hypothetical protein
MGSADDLRDRAKSSVKFQDNLTAVRGGAGNLRALRGFVMQKPLDPLGSRGFRCQCRPLDDFFGFATAAQANDEGGEYNDADQRD